MDGYERFHNEEFSGEERGGSKGEGELEPWLEQVSWRPRAYVYHNFLSQAEADHLIDLAIPYVKRSTVVGEDV